MTVLEKWFEDVLVSRPESLQKGWSGRAFRILRGKVWVRFSRLVDRGRPVGSCKNL